MSHYEKVCSVNNLCFTDLSSLNNVIKPNNLLSCEMQSPQACHLCAHLSVAKGDVDDDVSVACCDGRAVDRNAVDSLFMAGNSYSGSLGEPEEKIVAIVSDK